MRDAVEVRPRRRSPDIYNEVIRTSTAVFNDAPVTVEDRVAWWKARVAQGYADARGQGREWDRSGLRDVWGFSPVAGVPVHGRGNAFTLMLRHGRKGVGAALLRVLIARARAAGKHVIGGGRGLRERCLAASSWSAQGSSVWVTCARWGISSTGFWTLAFLQYMLEPAAI